MMVCSPERISPASSPSISVAYAGPTLWLPEGNRYPVMTRMFASTPVSSRGKTTCRIPPSGLRQVMLNKFAGSSSLQCAAAARDRTDVRSEEHTSELQSHVNLVCRLLLEKKK